LRGEKGKEEECGVGLVVTVDSRVATKIMTSLSLHKFLVEKLSQLSLPITGPAYTKTLNDISRHASPVSNENEHLSSQPHWCLYQSLNNNPIGESMLIYSDPC